VDSRPVRDPFDQALLDPVRQGVAQPFDLGGVFVADHDGLVPSRPELLAPADEPPDLAGQVGVDVAHEARELEGVVDIQEEVKMGGGKHVVADADRVLPLGPAEDADDDVVERRAGSKEETAVEGPAGDLDEGRLRGCSGVFGSCLHKT